MKLQSFLTHKFKDNEIIHFTDFLLLSDYYFYGLSKPHEWWDEIRKKNKKLYQIKNSIKNQSAVLYCYAKETALEHCFKLCANHPQSKYSIVLTRTDHSVSSDITRIIPKNVKLFCHNLTSVHHRSHALPYGVKLNRHHKDWIGRFHHPKDYDFDNRKLLYCNFSLRKHKGYELRNRIYRKLKKHDWITFAHMGAFMRYKISQSQYHNDLLNHKFTWSPRGNGIDCYRTWEALYLKSIPIVQKHKYWRHFTDLPILVIDSYDQISPSFLEEKYREMSEKTFDISKLNLLFWQQKIRKN